MMTLKKDSSKWIKTKGDDLADFYWQAGYGAFSVSRSQIDSVASYIHDQRRHHATMTFEEEFIAMLTKHGVQYDPRYVWG